MSTYFIEKCRACDSSNKYADLFHQNNHLLLANFKQLVPLSVSEDDGLSRWLCQNCVETVDSFIVFIDICKYTKLKYEPILGEIQDPDTINDQILMKDETLINDDPLTNSSSLIDDNEANVSTGGNSEDESVEIVILKNSEQPENEEEIKDVETWDETEANNEFLENEAPEMVFSSSLNFKCNFCSKNYTKKSNLSRHIQTSHKNKRFVCPQCPKSFTQSSTLSDHIKKKHNSQVLELLSDQIFECDVCQVSTNSKLEMQRHVNTHLTNSKLFHCKICPDKAYSHSNNLSRHMAAFHLNKKHYCDDCGRCFTQRGSLNEHRRNMHQNPLNEAKFECEICHKVLNTLKMYQQHLRRHDGNLIKDVKISSAVKPIKAKPVADGTPKKKYRRLCPWCGKFYKHLEEHMMLHKGEKIHKCEYCAKTFTFKTTLTAHLRIHTGCRPYQCTLCPKSFRVSHHLKEHQSIHSNTKDFICLICEKSFNSKLTLYKHTKIHQSSHSAGAITQATVQTQNIEVLPPGAQYTFYSTFQS